ncbi:uncharacterized protein LOC113211356 [Frankliniella occidentalis]|uniref:Uncharacterized protein LOC113211356 n=1 Tax=Frankliniella occidentalis TaxID=133901 RepID=A0A9C6X2X8_FRAOC|nr:uncharacterized protein LOC113211356 [Frankliniella occidentalis]
MVVMQCASAGCGAAAASVCANCGVAAYCSKEHQREHWPQHKAGCFPCALQADERLGRFLATSRAVQPGTVLVREWPLVVGPRADSSRPVCLGCHCPLPPLTGGASCSACGAPVCDADCEKLAAHAQWECKALRKATVTLPPAAVLPLRCLLGVRSGLDGWTTFLELEAHLDQRRGTAVWSDRQSQVVEVLRAAGVVPADGSEDELVQRICGILDVNSFEVRGPAAAGSAGEPLRAVFLRAAMMAHSCVPNCQLSVDDNLQLQVRASCAVPRATPVQYNYCELLESTARRQEHLREGKYFECSCARCSDPSECGTHLGSLWCPHCLTGLVVPPVHNAQQEGAPAAPERTVRALPPGVATLPASCSIRVAKRPPRAATTTPPTARTPEATAPSPTPQGDLLKAPAPASTTPAPAAASAKGTKGRRKGGKHPAQEVPKGEVPRPTPAAKQEVHNSKKKSSNQAKAGKKGPQEGVLEGKLQECPPAASPQGSPEGSPKRASAGSPTATAAVPWRCTSCGRGMAARAAESAVLRCAEAWEAARLGDDLDARGLEALLAHLSRTLHPRHALQLAAKQVLVALYRDHALAARRPAAHALARMQELCQEILDVLELLQPGHLSRLKGIALHEMHVAVALAGGDLERARALLRASLEHLQLEPPDSPEGRLHALALQELVAVEDSLRQEALQGQLQEERRVRATRRRKK